MGLVNGLRGLGFLMPLLPRHIPSGFPDCVHIPLKFEQRLILNHGMPAKRLEDERGGLSPDEAVAIVEDREWRRMTMVQLVDAFRKHGWIEKEGEGQ